MNINPDDFQGDCPMSAKNIEKYNLSVDLSKTFCILGCSPKCGEILICRLNHIKNGGK